MTAEEMNVIASRHNHQKVSKSDTVFAFDKDGRQLFHWHEQDGKILELDSYNGILGTYTLGVDCFKVVRHRETVVTETFTPL
jgi:hypothetical protein